MLLMFFISTGLRDQNRERERHFDQSVACVTMEGESLSLLYLCFSVFCFENIGEGKI